MKTCTYVLLGLDGELCGRPVYEAAELGLCKWHTDETRSHRHKVPGGRPKVHRPDFKRCIVCGQRIRFRTTKRCGPCHRAMKVIRLTGDAQ